jgi:hypothetical protein
MPICVLEDRADSNFLPRVSEDPLNEVHFLPWVHFAIDTPALAKVVHCTPFITLNKEVTDVDVEDRRCAVVAKNWHEAVSSVAFLELWD